MTIEKLDAARVFPRNMVEQIRTLAALRPADTALVAVSRDGETRLDYRALDERVRALAALLQQRFAPGERVLLMLDNDEHYVVAFLACLHAGVIAVPVFPPESTREQHLARLAAIAADCRPGGVLTSAAIHEMVASHARIFGSATVVEVDAVGTACAAAWRMHDPADADIAFLQYTSGSTSAPKGVMVSHGNLMANERAIEERLAVQADDVFVNWLPLYHDMGLIGGLLQPLHRGIPVVLMSPGFFLERPVRWLEAIARHRGTISGGPDFAYRLCIDRVKEGRLAGLDLSSWRVAFSGAEPVRHDTLQRFTAQFSAAGFRADAPYPCYGLAESTLLVSGGVRGAGVTARRFSAESLAQGGALEAEDGMALVGCGVGAGAHRIDIVDPQAQRALPAGRIGEIWAAGPSVARGYWNRPEESGRSFVQRDGQRWLRTGDLGFMHGGELFITGRIKDLIIVRGHNLYPQDIERCIEAEIRAVRSGRVAAFAVETAGGEGIGIAAEVSRSMQRVVAPEALLQALSEAVGSLCGEPVAVLVLLHAGGLPKTSSGKLQRSACRQGWMDGSLDAYALCENGRWVRGGTRPAAGAAPLDALDALEAGLASLWMQVLRRDADHPVGADEHFFAAGGHSLAAVQLASAIAEQWDVDFPVRLVFEHPRLTECAAELRRRLAADTGPRATKIAPLPPQQRSGALPLSHAQERQWFLWRLDPSSAAYHLAVALRLRGALDAGALRCSFDTLVARHEALRTVFETQADGLPAQRIGPAFSLDLPLIDLRGGPDRERRAREEARRLQTLAMDLRTGPLLRASLIRLADEEHLLVVVVHHIVSDGTSMQRLVDELAACYGAHAQGAAPNLPALPIQHVDHALWQRQWLAGGEGDRQLAWWREQLGTEHPMLQLAGDHANTPGGPDGPQAAACHSVVLPVALLTRLRERARSHGATLFMVLLAGFQAVLHRHTGQRDIRLGVPVANRTNAQTQAVVGFFVNTLVLRGLVDGRMTLDQVLAQAKAMVVGAQARQDLPFEHLVEQLRPARGVQHNALFQVMFNHRIEDHGALQAFPGLVAEAYPLAEPAAQFDLALDAVEQAGGGVTLHFNHAAHRIDAGTIERLAGQFQAMLQVLAEQPSCAVGDVPLLGNVENERLLQWGTCAACPAVTEPVHELITRQARAEPQAPALRFGGEVLSRSALERAANRLAHRLVAAGVRADTRVGVVLERSPAMVIAVLAILKAGGAYVPLDPDDPPQRLAEMASGSGIVVWLTQAALTSRLLLPAHAQVIELDNIALGGDEPDHAPGIAIHPEQLAYVIHTSGSTGRPKGVGVSHGALARHLQAAMGYLRLTPEDRVLQFSTISFDGFVEQLFAPLVAGAAVVLRGPALWDSATFQREVSGQRVTVADLPAAYWNLLAQDLAARAPCDLGPLRQVHVSGEAMPPQGVKAWRDAGLSTVALLNLYGPTETVVTATAHACRLDQPGPVPIGRPLPGRQAFVLDADLNLAPQGSVGELYIGGPLLARGYLSRPALSAERFVADPFGRQGGRLYRTGDLVRWNGEGALEYLGRVDHQVKLRGLRVELGEVEAQLLALPGVREAVAVAGEGPAGARLLGYVSMADARQADGPALRERLRAALPEYMVPSAVVVLPSLPLNASGKVDRQALPEPAMARAEPGEQPQGDLEAALARLWTELLGVPQVGRHESFFELGGHSLLLLQAHRRIEERLGLHPSVVDLFRYPTVASLAAFLSSPAPAMAAAPLHQPERVEERGKRQRAAFLPRPTRGLKVPT